MSGREAWKADKRALKNAHALNKRQRRNMRAYISVILQTKRALDSGDTLRAMALVSANFKFPPDMSKDLDCDHEFKFHSVVRCVHCRLIDEE